MELTFLNNCGMWWMEILTHKQTHMQPYILRIKKFYFYLLDYLYFFSLAVRDQRLWYYYYCNYLSLSSSSQFKISPPVRDCDPLVLTRMNVLWHGETYCHCHLPTRYLIGREWSCDWYTGLWLAGVTVTFCHCHLPTRHNHMKLAASQQTLVIASIDPGINGLTKITQICRKLF